MGVYGGGERAHRVVRGNRHVVGLGDRRDLAHLEQTAAHAHVGLNDVGAARGQEIEELEATASPQPWIPSSVTTFSSTRERGSSRTGWHVMAVIFMVAPMVT